MTTIVEYLLQEDSWDENRLAALRAQLGRKFEVGDLTIGLRSYARWWLLKQKPDDLRIEFLKTMAITVGYGGPMTDPQTKGVLNCIAARAQVRAERRVEDPVTEVGAYKHDEDIYKVQKSRQSGNLYAKILVVGDRKGRFEYAPGAIKLLSASERMTLEQAKEYGAEFGVCCNCGATLIVEKSIEAGIGPVCAKRFRR
jgi:Family of unknown function (DUF6011)